MQDDVSSESSDGEAVGKQANMERVGTMAMGCQQIEYSVLHVLHELFEICTWTISDPLKGIPLQQRRVTDAEPY